MLSHQLMKTMMMMKMKQWRSEGRQQEVELSSSSMLQDSQPISSHLCLKVFSSRPRPPRDPLKLHPPQLLRQKKPPPRQPTRSRPHCLSPPPVPPLRYDITWCIQVLLGNLSVVFIQFSNYSQVRLPMMLKGSGW